VCVRLGANGLGAEGGAALAAELRTHPGRLEMLTGVELREVDPDLPLELKGAGNRAILGYYRDLLSGPGITSRRCRVMLLGNGGVGKTTLAHRLVDGCPPAADAGTTHGVLQRKSLSDTVRYSSLFSEIFATVHLSYVAVCVVDLSDVWTVHHDQVGCVPTDGPLEVSITDFGGQVRGVTLLACIRVWFNVCESLPFAGGIPANPPGAVP
jgi:hypothetical protein